MGRTFRIFALEMRALFSNVVTIIITIGLALMPSLFTWYNVLSCWDVFNNTGELSVAVANSDEGYSSDLFPLEVNVGESVVSALRANEQINWVFTTEEDAIDGAESGRYYAAVVIPEGFSRAMLTFYQEDAEQAPLVYYQNEKKNAIAPKITTQGADSVSYQVNKVFAETLADIALNIAQSVSNYLDNADVQSRIAALGSTVDTMGNRVDQTVGVLNLYVQLVQSSQTILSSTSDLVSSVKGSVSEVKDITMEGLSESQDTLDTLNSSIDAMVSAIQASIDAISQISQETPSIDTPDAQATADELRKQASNMDTQIEAYKTMRDALVEKDPDAYATEISALNVSIEEMEALQKSLNETADNIEAGNVQIDSALIEDKAAAAKEALEQLKTTIDQDLRAKVAEVSAAVDELRSSVLVLYSELSESADALESGVEQGQSSIGNAAASLNNMVTKLSNAATTLHSVATQIKDALSSEDITQLRDLLGSNMDVLSSALAAPVGVERHTLYESENFGSSMTPLYATIGMFVGALLIMVGVKPRSSQKVIEEASTKKQIKPRHEFFGHFGICAFISIMQSTILATGNMFFLQVQVTEPLLFYLCYWVTSLTFTFFIYSLVVSFANLGKAIAVILLIVQVTGCNGSYPLQLLPWFVNAISPFLPATHVVTAMREAMFGLYGTVFWEQLALVAVWMIPALALGLFLRKPFASFMKWYVNKVEDSELMA